LDAKTASKTKRFFLFFSFLRSSGGNDWHNCGGGKLWREYSLASSKRKLRFGRLKGQIKVLGGFDVPLQGSLKPTWGCDADC